MVGYEQLCVQMSERVEKLNDSLKDDHSLYELKPVVRMMFDDVQMLLDALASEFHELRPKGVSEASGRHERYFDDAGELIY